MSQEPSSSFKALDLLNQSAALQHGSPVTSKPAATTKFEKVVNSLSSFLTTASDTIITVDSLINGPNGSNGVQQTPAAKPGSQLPAAASTTSYSPTPIDLAKWALWGSIAAGGALLGYAAITGNQKRKR